MNWYPIPLSFTYPYFKGFKKKLYKSQDKRIGTGSHKMGEYETI